MEIKSVLMLAEYSCPQRGKLKKLHLLKWFCAIIAVIGRIGSRWNRLLGAGGRQLLFLTGKFFGSMILTENGRMQIKTKMMITVRITVEALLPVW